MSECDATLLQRVINRDQAAFCVLFDRYQRQVTRHLLRIVRDPGAADDLTQEVFLRVWNRSDQWTGKGKFQSWLFRIATNLALNHLRSTKRKREQPLEMPAIHDEDEVETPGWMIDRVTPGPDERVEQAERRARLQKLVEELPEEKRTVFEMVYEAEMPLKVVADRLAISEGTVKSRLFHARRRIAEGMRSDD